MIKLELSEQHIAIIGQALGNAPYNVAAPVVAELQRQINEQQKPAHIEEAILNEAA